MVVCVTDDYDTKSNIVQTYTNNSDVIIENVDYTYAALLQEQNRISEIYEAKYEEIVQENLSEGKTSVVELLTSFCGSYVDTKNNLLIVEVENLNDEKIETFQTMFSECDFVRLRQGTPVVLDSSNTSVEPMADDGDTSGSIYFNSGGKIYDSSNGYSSIGYPVYFTSSGSRRYGFIAAGHAKDRGNHASG